MFNNNTQEASEVSTPPPSSTSTTFIQLPTESIVHCLSFLHSQEIFEHVLPVCKLFQNLTYTRQLWDFVYFSTPKNSDVSITMMNKFPIRHILINSKHFSIPNLLKLQEGLHVVKSVILSFVSVDHQLFITLLNGLTGIERLTLERCKIINYSGGTPCETLENDFARLKILGLKGMQGDYLTKLRPIQLLVSKAKNVTHLTMKRNQPHMLSEIYHHFHSEMQLESISIEEEHMFHLNQETHVLDNFFSKHCSTRLRRLAIINCRNHFDTILGYCCHTLEQLLLVAVNWHMYSNEHYPELVSLARLDVISCANHVIEPILSSCVRESVLQVKLSSPSKSDQAQATFISPRLRSFKSHYALPFKSIAPIVLGCDRSLECLEFGFAKRALLAEKQLQNVFSSLSESLLHLSIENVVFDNPWWLLSILQLLNRLETLHIDTASSKSSLNDIAPGVSDSDSIGNKCNLRVLSLEECDLTADCFNRTLQYCGSNLEQLIYDFSYDKTELIAEKMKSIAKHCGPTTVLTISYMDEVPQKLEMFAHELPLITFNVRDLELEDILLLAIICDNAKCVEFNKDQGALNFGLVEQSEQQEGSIIDTKTFHAAVREVVNNRISNLNDEMSSKLLNRYLSMNLNDVQKNRKSLMKAISAVQHPT
jgi:hypothetical protein